MTLPLLIAGLSLSSPNGLRCEWMTDPIGVDAVQPRLCWMLPQAKDSVTVVLAADRQWRDTLQCHRLPPGTHSVMLNNLPHGQAKTYYWNVAVGGEASETAQFTTNLPIGKAHWITDGRDKDERSLAKYRRLFKIKKNVKEAFLTIVSAGPHELSLNGQRVGNHCLDPMYTRFDRRLLSVMHDVGRLVQTGDNILCVELGNGWYNHQSTAVWFFHEASWRNRPRFAARLLLRYEDGEEEEIVTDCQWQTALGATTFSSIYTAEHYDARLEGKENWQPVTLVECPTQRITSQVMHPIRRTAVYKAVKMVRLSDTLVVYHFPKNMAGVTRLRVRGEAGTVLRLKHGEMLYPDGRVNLGNIDYHFRPTDDTDPFQTDIVTLSGRDDEFTPRFGYKGFQYVEVSSSSPVHLDEESLVAEEMHSDVPAIGTWHSSSDFLNRLLAATNNSYLSNLFGYPTDCPQREKNGWTADAYLALETGMSTYDVVTIYEKWLADFRDEQRDDGRLPCIIPTDKWGYDWANGVDWTSATIIIPWQIYLYYDNRQLLATHYDCMRRYMIYLESIQKDYLTDWGLGDWIPVKTVSDLTYTTSVYFFVDACIMAKTATLLGKTDDASHYQELARNIRLAINRRYLNVDKGIYANGSQTELAMALYWGVAPDELRGRIAANLDEAVRQRDYHLDVGVHGSKAILSALSDNGYPETAWKLVSQTTYPSWGYWITQGATTLHENWRTDVIVDNSLNHIMFGEVGAWLYRGLAGIRPCEEVPGFREVTIRPYFPDSLDSLRVSRQTDFGMLMTSWHREGNHIEYTVSVPPAMSARISLPDGQHHELHGEEKTFIIK